MDPLVSEVHVAKHAEYCGVSGIYMEEEDLLGILDLNYISLR